ncbi:MAG: hypothetical protein RDU14_16745 [Melioribacteraceae bacterium]|nr:hypothetical protein [Melioribacteraceae bacterium]
MRWWKDYYKYSSNSVEYLTATETQIYSDYNDYKAKRYLEEIGSGTEIETVLRQKALDPGYDEKENESFKESLKKIEIIKL